MPADPTPTAALQRALARDAARPLVTFYDDETGERTELSVATFANWVAKTAGLLRDELGVVPGDAVALLLRPHWLTLVWAHAVWACGALVCDAGYDAGPVRVAAATPDRVPAALALADDVVAVALHPFAGPSPQPLPAGVLDFGIEVRGQGDQLVVLPATGPALAVGTHTASAQDLTARGTGLAAGAGLPERGRLLADCGGGEDDSFGPLLDGLLAALAVDGSLVACARLDRARLGERASTERVDVALADLASGGGRA